MTLSGKVALVRQSLFSFGDYWQIESRSILNYNGGELKWHQSVGVVGIQMLNPGCTCLLMGMQQGRYGIIL